jgi:hypothetical protein
VIVCTFCTLLPIVCKNVYFELPPETGRHSHSPTQREGKSTGSYIYLTSLAQERSDITRVGGR